MTCPTETELLAAAETDAAPHCDDCAPTVAELRSTIALLRRAAELPAPAARPPRWIALAAAVLVVAATAVALLHTPPVAAPDRAAAPAAQDDESIRALVRKLGDESMEQRDAAEAELVRLGKKAAPFLEEGLKHADAEVRSRCGKLLKRLAREEAAVTMLRGRADRRKAAGGAADDQLRAALTWLTKNQAADGSWGGTGVTALALLAYLAAGEGESSKEHGQAVSKGLGWLKGIQAADGLIGDRASSKAMYGHAMATWALAEATGGGFTSDDSLRDAAKNAIAYLVKARNPGAAWRYTALSGDSDSSVTFWACSALAVAKRAGFDVPDAALDGARGWFAGVTDRFGRVGYHARGTGKVFIPGVNDEFDHHETLAAAAAAARILAGDAIDDVMTMQLASLKNDPPSHAEHAVDFYYWHIASLAVFQIDGPDGAAWKAWNAKLLEALGKLRGADGAWNHDRWSGDPDAGAVYATAINALTLTTPYRYPRLRP